MKKILWKAIAIVAVGCPGITAQLSQGVKARVPFSFIAGNKSFASGEYRVKLYLQTGVLSIQSADGKAQGFAMCGRTESARIHPDTILAFNRHGTQYFLNQMWMEGETAGVELPKENWNSHQELRAL